MADGSTTPGAQGAPANYGNVPVIISAVLGVVAGLAVAVFSSGGSEQEFRWQLGVAAACATFIVSLLIFLVLIATASPNPEHLGEGTGVRRSFGALPDASDSSDSSTTDGPER